MTKDAAPARIKRTSPKWHVISEMDLMRMVADHSQLEQTCAVLLNGSESTLQLSIRLRELLNKTLIPQGASEEAWLEERLLDREGPPIAHALRNAIRAGHCALIHECRSLAMALKASTEMPWELVHEFINTCRQSMMLKALAISYLAGPRLTPEARELLEYSMVSLQGRRIDA